MKHQTHVLSLAVLCFLLASLSPAPGQEPPPPQSATPEPQFKKESSKASFEKGKALFEKGDYKKAARQFKSALRGTESKADREIVSRWEKGAKAAPQVAVARRFMDQKQLHTAYGHLMKVYSRVIGTPALQIWQKTNDELEKKLFVRLENFDHKRSYFSKKYGKTFERRPELLLNGKGMCLRWQNTPDLKPGMLKLPVVPSNWDEFHAVQFWVRTPRPVPIDVVVTTAEAPRTGKGPRPPSLPVPPGGRKRKIVHSFMAPRVLKALAGWQLYQVRLVELKPSGNPSYSVVKDFRLQIHGGRKYDFLIDDIRLMRKDTASGKKPRRGRRR